MKIEERERKKKTGSPISHIGQINLGLCARRQTKFIGGNRLHRGNLKTLRRLVFLGVVREDAFGFHRV